MGWVVPLLNAVAAIPKIAGYVERFAAAVTGWYVERQTSKTLALIADAAALSARAKTHEERLNAAQAWVRALSRDRYSV